MTDVQLVVATVWTLFVLAFFAAVYALEFIAGRLEHILGRPLERIEQRMQAMESPLREANRHRETLIARIVSLTERL